MNERFTDEQIRAYAAQFREGDAIWCGGKWCEIIVNRDYSHLSAKYSKNNFIVNYGGELFEGTTSGFNKTSLSQDRYRVTTLGDYKLQGGEKIVWLGGSDDFRTFGKVYRAENYNTFTCDKGIVNWSICGGLWGVIPRYEQVKKRNVTDEEFDNLLNEIDKTLEPIKNANQLSHVVQYPTAADREEEVLKLKIFELFVEDMSDDDVIDDLKDIAIVQIRKNNYDKAIEAFDAIKEWEENSK